MKTQTQHTPGPWNVGDDSPNEYEGPTVENIDTVIAVIPIDDINDSSPEERANARLIAAAPDLLAALEQLKALAEEGVIHRNETGKPQWSLTDEIKNITRAAITKATSASL